MSDTPAPIQHERGKPIRLHIGGTSTKEGWTILNAQQLPGTDIVGNCTDLSMFAEGAVTEIYASHVYEHLSYQGELMAAFKEAFRVLVPGGLFRLGVPDLDACCRLFISPQLDVQAKFYIQRVMMGGQVDPWDFHKSGFNFEILGGLLHQTGFRNIRRVPHFDLFKDMTEVRFGNVSLSLNVQCTKG